MLVKIPTIYTRTKRPLKFNLNLLMKYNKLLIKKYKKSIIYLKGGNPPSAMPSNWGGTKKKNRKGVCLGTRTPKK